MSTIVLAILAVAGMVTAMVCMALEEDRNKEVTVEKELTKQAAQITKALAQLDALNRKAGN